MTPPRSIVGTMAKSRWLGNRWLRRGIFSLLVVICAVLTFFPERYRAAVTLTPTDPSSLGLSQTLSQLGALNSVFGNQAAIEISIRVANSVYVRDTVIQRLGLKQKLGLSSSIDTSRWLSKNIDIRTMRGGIVQIEMYGRDPAFAQRVVGAVADATQQRLAEIAQRQTRYKRRILEQLVSDADARLSRATVAYNAFRLQNRYANPNYSIEAIGSRIPALQAAIKAKEVELNAVRQFGTDQNMSVQQVLAELAELNRQLQQQKALNPSTDNSVGKVVSQSTEADRLEREFTSSRALYYGYRNYLQGTAVEDLTSNANVRVLEPAFVDTARQINYFPLALGLLLLVLLGSIEFYGLRPPVGEQRQ